MAMASIGRVFHTLNAACRTCSDVICFMRCATIWIAEPHSPATCNDVRFSQSNDGEYGDQHGDQYDQVEDCRPRTVLCDMTSRCRRHA